MEIGFGVNVGDYPSAVRVRFAFSGGEHTWDAIEELSEDRSQRNRYGTVCCSFNLPKIVELVIPTPFLKATSVDNANAIVHAVNANFIGAESNNVAILDVGGMYGAVFLVSKSFYEYPVGREWGVGMCVGDFGERGYESGMEDIFVDKRGHDTEGGYGAYRKHLVQVPF